jgi:hypothetical protein
MLNQSLATLADLQTNVTQGTNNFARACRVTITPQRRPPLGSPIQPVHDGQSFDVRKLPGVIGGERNTQGQASGKTAVLA